MKTLVSRLVPLVSLFLLLAGIQSAQALTVGETYTITIEKLNSDGSLTSGGTSLGVSTTAVADSDGKLSFSFPSGVPDNSSCNFMVITLTNSSDAVERRSIVPCPDAGKALPLGVSGITQKQADALIEAFSNAGTDDPILAVFGMTIVRSEGITSAELSTMANICQQGIVGSGGFVDDMTSKGVTSAQLATYRKKIVSLLADPDDGYSKLVKDSVDVADVNDSTLAAAKRGEAAAKLLGVLVTAATDAGFSQDRVLEAFNAMGAIAVPLITTATNNGSLSAATAQSINSSVGGGIQKLRADRGIEKYTQAMSTLGASGADLSQYSSAANTLVSGMADAFAEFEKVFTGSETDSDVSSAQSTLDSTMSTLFNAFITATASSDARISTMISNIDNALGVSTGLSKNNFQMYKSDGTASNWSIMMVVITDWLSSVKSGGGSVSYTRDSISIPSSITWIGSCSNNSYTNQTDCQNNGATWTAGRTTFGSGGQNIPSPYAELFAIQEDIMIREFVRFSAQQSAGSDMSAQNTLEKAFSDGLLTIAGNISGTTDGSTSITTAQKQALVELLQSPQF